MRVVLDTNSLLVSIGRKSKYRPIFDALLAGDIIVIENEENNTELMDRQVTFNVGYQARTKADLLKVFSYMGQSAISVTSKKESSYFYPVTK